MSGRLKLKSIFPTFESFKLFCDNQIFEFYPQIIDMPNPTTIHNELDRYIYKPLYRQFKNATCRYLPTEEGIEAFSNQFSNTLEEVVFDFLVYTSTNIYYFNEAYANIGQNLLNGVNTVNSPINQDVKNTKSNTVIADGATAQTINTIIYNGKTVWRNAFASYYTPQKKAELIDHFRWLFISFYVGAEEGVTLVELTEALSMADGDMVITPEEAEILRKIIIEKPATLIPENIKKGVDIGGIVGTFEDGGSKMELIYDGEFLVDEEENLINFINKEVVLSLTSNIKRALFCFSGDGGTININATSLGNLNLLGENICAIGGRVDALIDILDFRCICQRNSAELGDMVIISISSENGASVDYKNFANLKIYVEE